MPRKRKSAVDEPSAKRRKGQASNGGKSSSKQKCKCDACGMWFSQRCNLSKHLRLGRCPGQSSAQKRASLLKCSSVGCRLEFPSRLQLKEHQEQVHQRLFFHCSQCSCWRARWSHVVTHALDAHGVELPTPQNLGFQCVPCRDTYVSAKALREHARECRKRDRPGGRKIYECGACPTKLTTRPDWKAHLEQIHQRKLFSCRKCSYWAATWERLMRHAVKRHAVLLVKVLEDMGFRCWDCKKRYVSREALREHGRQEHGTVRGVSNRKQGNPRKRPLSSSEEDEPEDAWEDLLEPSPEKQAPGHGLHIPKRKMTVEKVGGQQIHHCTSCSTVLSTRAEFKVHLEKVHQRKLFTCPNCPFWRASWILLAHHVKKAHDMELETPKDKGVNCVRCRKLYVSGKALRDHRSRRECLEQLQRCFPCALQLNSRQELRVHLEQVHQRKLFPCDQCTYWSGQWTQLVGHARNRHGIVPTAPEDKGFWCWDCKKSFVSRDALTDHRRQEHGASVNIRKKAVRPQEPKMVKAPPLPPLAEVEEMIRRLDLRVEAHEQEREKRFDPKFFLHLNRYKPD